MASVNHQHFSGQQNATPNEFQTTAMSPDAAGEIAVTEEMSAVQRVFGIVELVENILYFVPRGNSWASKRKTVLSHDTKKTKHTMPAVDLFGLLRVSRSFKAIISESPRLRESMAGPVSQPEPKTRYPGCLPEIAEYALTFGVKFDAAYRRHVKSSKWPHAPQVKPSWLTIRMNSKDGPYVRFEDRRCPRSWRHARGQEEVGTERETTWDDLIGVTTDYHKWDFDFHCVECTGEPDPLPVRIMKSIRHPPRAVGSQTSVDCVELPHSSSLAASDCGIASPDTRSMSRKTGCQKAFPMFDPMQ